MLARLQQLIVATLLIVTWAAFATGATLDLPWLAWVWFGVVLVGYTGTLALEFIWLDKSYAADDTLRPTRGQLLAAWTREISAAPRVFLWRQPFRSRSEPDHLPATTRRRGVLFVHGFFCNRGLWNGWLARFRRAGIPFVAVNLEPVFASIDDHGATIAAAVASLHQATGLAPIVVAHSMGGLAVRAWLVGQSKEEVHHVVTIASPHAGTRLGEHGIGANVHGANIRQMRFGSDWLMQLSKRESAASRARFTCFWGHCDNIVFPTRSATLRGADNVHLAATPHVHMVDRPEIFREVLRIVSKAT